MHRCIEKRPAALAIAALLVTFGISVPAGAVGDDRFPHARGGNIVFRIEAPEDAEVFLVGDFNNWDEEATPLRSAGRNLWEVALPLEPGDYQYKYVVNGRRLLDASNPDEVSGEDGSLRSRIRVLPNGRVSERSHWTRQSRRRRDHVPSGWSHDDWRLGGDLTFSRVDGTTFWLKPSYRTQEDFTPEISAAFGYGWESERINIEADFAQPLMHGRSLFLGLHFIDGTSFENQAEVGRSENTMAALFFKHDFNDYYEIEAVEPYIRLHVPADAMLRLSYASEDYRSLTAQTQWSFFEAGRDRFRPNPHLYLLGDPGGFDGEGRLQATRIETTIDSRRARHVGTVGYYGRGFVEFGRGDFDYARWVADGRTYLRLGRPVHLAMRLRGGARFEDERIPSQKLFYIGGLGTVRGHAFRSQVGDRHLLGNLEYTFLLDELNWGALLFYDAGTAWESQRSTLDEATLLQAVGFGFRSGEDDFQINFAKPIGGAKGGIETTVRLNRTF